MSAIKKVLSSLVVIAFTVVGGIIGGPLGAAIGAAIGTVVAGQIFKPKKGATQDQGKSIVRLPESPRWWSAGRNRVGGAAVFGEFDGSGNFWYVVIHCDSILDEAVQYYFDDVPITVDGSGMVTTGDFCLSTKKAPWQSGTKVPYFQIWTTTHSASNPTPPGVSVLIAALGSKWTANHKLVGTTYSVVKCGAIDDKYRQNLYKWRGVFGLGEPGLTLVGDWSRCYDPRDETQELDDPSTHKFTRNPILIWAKFRTDPYGRNKPASEVNWNKVGEEANVCDATISGDYGTHVRYQCGALIPENRERDTAEQMIIASCDGQLVYDDEGKAWVRAGYYYTPSVGLNRNRDIVAMEVIEAINGESETQGVIVRYTDPDADYTMQPSAPWYNPIYYVEGQGVNFLTVDVDTIQDHNQAMRYAKSLGLRIQPAQKCAPMVGLRGLRARQERIVNLNYDNTISGDYEIYSPVEVDPSGQFTSFAVVPVDEDRWVLLDGEEKPKPVIDGEPGIPPVTIPDPVLLSLAFANGRIEATFDVPARDDITFQMEYIPTADIGNDTWSPMVVQMNELFAYSGVVSIGVDYSVRYRSVAASGRASDWSDPPDELTPEDPTSATTRLAIYNSWIVEASQGTAVLTIASDGTLTIIDHTRRYPDGFPDTSVEGDVIATGLAPAAIRSVAYDDIGRAGGAVTYALYADDNEARTSTDNPGRHYMGYFIVPSSGSSGGGGGSNPGGPWQGPEPTP